MATEDVSYTNSSLATARRCLTEYDLRYELRLERYREDESEALAVGSTWHAAFDAKTRGEDPYETIRKHAPNVVWAEKLTRLFAAYLWYWRDQLLPVIAAEEEFSVVHRGVRYRGKRDEMVQTLDGRVGLLERKTTADNLEDDSSYWEWLRLDMQVGLYAITRPGQLPAFIMYDVTRKPTINPKSIPQKEITRIRSELSKNGHALYFEKFTADQIELALQAGMESPAMYGARLTSDIGDRPAYYFARRLVPRTEGDYQSMIANLEQQVALLEFAKANGLMHRNPDACSSFGRLCEFFPLCSANIRPTRTDPVPSGYSVRAKMHPELSPDNEV